MYHYQILDVITYKLQVSSVYIYKSPFTKNFNERSKDYQIFYFYNLNSTIKQKLNCRVDSFLFKSDNKMSFMVHRTVDHTSDDEVIIFPCIVLKEIQNLIIKLFI